VCDTVKKMWQKTGAVTGCVTIRDVLTHERNQANGLNESRFTGENKELATRIYTGR